MNEFIKKSLVVIFLLMQVRLAFGGENDQLGPGCCHVPSIFASSKPTSLEDLPEVILFKIAEALDPVSRARFAVTHRGGRDSVDVVKAQAFKWEFAKMNMLTLPSVTEGDVADLQRARVETSIRGPVNSFKISDTPITMGFYYAVMGRHPDPSQTDWIIVAAVRDILWKRWRSNPELPLTYTSIDEDQAFIAILNQRTGRHFRLPTESELEYAIRGRNLEEGQATGQITTTLWHFGNSKKEVQNYAWIARNSGDFPHGVREALPGRSIAESKNSFGLIHPIGNIFIRTSEGVIRGGSVGDSEDYLKSSSRLEEDVWNRSPYVGIRLVEDVHP